MREEYDFSNAIKNPYISKKQITIKIDSSTIDYFKILAKENSISYQNLINLYLRDCAINKKTLKTTFV